MMALGMALCLGAHAFCPASTLGGRHLTTRHSRPRYHVLAVAPTLPDEEERLDVAEQDLETFDPKKATPPERDFNFGGYVCPPEKCTWEPFQYASPSDRRATVKQFVDDLPKTPTLPAMKIWCGPLPPPLRPCSRPPPPPSPPPPPPPPPPCPPPPPPLRHLSQADRRPVVRQGHHRADALAGVPRAHDRRGRAAARREARGHAARPRVRRAHGAGGANTGRARARGALAPAGQLSELGLGLGLG